MEYKNTNYTSSN